MAIARATPWEWDRECFSRERGAVWMAWRSSRPPSSEDSLRGGGGGFGDGAGRWAARSFLALSDSLVFLEKPGRVGDSGCGGGGGGGGDRACDAEDRRLEPALDLLEGVADGRFWRCSHAMAASSSELSESESLSWSSVNSWVDDRSRVSFSGV